MKINQRKVGSILSYAQMGISIILSILYTPVMLRLLGQSEYGLYSTVTSTISMISILNLGFNSGYIRYYSKYKKNNDKESIYKLNGLFLTIFIIIGIIALLCGLFLSFNLDLVFKDGLTPDQYVTAKILMLLLTFNLAISFPMSVFGNIIFSHEKFVFSKLIGIGKTVFGPLTNIILLLSGHGSVAMVIASVTIALIVDAIYLYYVLKVLKQKFVLGMPEKGLFASLFSYTIFIALNSVIDQINWNIDKLVITRFHGTEMTAVYSVGYSLYHYFQMFSTAISGVFSPAIHRIVNETKENVEKMKASLSEVFTRVGRVQFIILALIVSGVFFFGKPFIHFWAGGGYEDSYIVALLLMVPATVPLIQNLGIEIQRAQNIHQFRSIIYAVMAAINLMLSIILCQKYGAVGSAVGTSISLVLANGIIMNVYYQKRCHIDILGFWKSILRLSLGAIIPIAVGCLIVRFFNLYNIYVLVASIVLYTLVYVASMWLLGMNAYEKDLVRQPLKKIFRKQR
ncbi:MAG: polysaccharide biosynthesis protein [Ruminococcaceae bacterium]|nr:polysaccharide biosynthesis protein [Oscillospiraceae bacterium]